MEEKQLTFEDLSSSFPWKGNNIYLEQNDGQVKAVCSNEYIAEFIAQVVNAANILRTNPIINACNDTIQHPSSFSLDNSNINDENNVKLSTDLSIDNQISVDNAIQTSNADENAQIDLELKKQRKEERKRLYQNLVQNSYYFYVAFSKAKIPKNSIESLFLEKAYHKFYYSLFELLQKENISIDDKKTDVI